MSEAQARANAKVTPWVGAGVGSSIFAGGIVWFSEDFYYRRRGVVPKPPSAAFTVGMVGVCLTMIGGAIGKAWVQTRER